MGNELPQGVYAVGGGLDQRGKPIPVLNIQVRPFVPHGGVLWELPRCPHRGCGRQMQRVATPFVSAGPPDVLCPEHGNADLVFVVADDGWWAEVEA